MFEWPFSKPRDPKQSDKIEYSKNVVEHGKSPSGDKWVIVKSATGDGFFYAQVLGNLSSQWFHAKTLEEARSLGENVRATCQFSWIYNK